MKFLKRYKKHSFAILRILIGFMFSFHGMQKIFGILSDHHPAMWSQIWVGGLIELISGLFILIGLKTRFAAFLASGTMAVAYIQFHWKFQIDSNIFPAINEGELALVYSLLFLYFATMGGVKWCLDKID